MARYVVHRVLQAILVLWGAVTIVFLVVRVVPGNPALLLLGPNATRAQIIATQHRLGLDLPIPEQYVNFFEHAARLDFGNSVRLGGSAIGQVLERLPATLSLAVFALVITLLVGFPLGVLSARHPRSPLGGLVSIGSLAGQGMPQFWVGIMLVLVLSAQFQLLPASGFTSPSSLIMPGLALALPFMGWLTRSVRSAVMDELGSNYVRTARAKGLPSRVVFYGHIVRNTLVPTVTVVGLLLGIFIGSAVIVEQVFSWPGVGRLLIDAITYRDYSVVEAAVTVITAVYILLNLVVDVLYTYLDPRIRFGGN